jgi:Galactosyltransferase
MKAVLQNLLKLCQTSNCDEEAKYVGTFVSGAPVFMDTKHKWHNQAYIMHTAVKRYLPYAFGGGYILSGDIVKVCMTAACICACRQTSPHPHHASLTYQQRSINILSCHIVC